MGLSWRAVATVVKSSNGGDLVIHIATAEYTGLASRIL